MGTDNFQCVLRLSRRVFECRRFGSGIVPSFLLVSNHDIKPNRSYWINQPIKPDQHIQYERIFKLNIAWPGSLDRWPKCGQRKAALRFQFIQREALLLLQSSNLLLISFHQLRSILASVFRMRIQDGCPVSCSATSSGSPSADRFLSHDSCSGRNLNLCHTGDRALCIPHRRGASLG